MRQRSYGKIWVGCLGGALAAAFLFAACGRQEEAAVSEEPPMEITLGFWNVQDYLQGDGVQKYMEDRFHVRFVPVNYNYDNYSETLQQLAASDNLPDVFASDILGSQGYEAWISQGKIRALPKDLSACPGLEAYIDQPYNERFTRDDGSYYMIPRITYQEESMWALDRCIMVRRDWMEKLGLKEPESFEEFVELLCRFRDDDSDGNGERDTSGITATHLNTLEALYLGLFPELSNTERGWIYEDGQWMPVYVSRRTGEALEKIRELYRDGLLKSNFAYVSTEEALDDFVSGRVGAIACQYYSVVQHLQERGMGEQAEKIVQILPQWPAPDGVRYRFTTSLHWSESYFGANVSDEKMQKLLQIYDFLLSEEFKNIRQYGLEGTDWVMEEGEPVLTGTDATAPLLKYPCLNIFGALVEWNQGEYYDDTPANALRYGAENVRTANEMLAWYRENTKRVDYNFDITFMSTPAKNNIIFSSEVQSEMVKVIMGSEDAGTAWPRALEQLKGRSTLEQAIEEVTQQAGHLGVTRQEMQQRPETMAPVS